MELIIAHARRTSLLALVLVAGSTHPVRADIISNTAVRADNATLAAAGLPYIPTGAGVRVGQSEGTLPFTSTFPQGSVNPVMPPSAGAPANGSIVLVTALGAQASFDFHATVVAGTMMAPGSGIAPNMQLVSVQNTASAMWASQHALRDAGDNAKILNMSWGPGRPPGSHTPARNGNGLHSVWADWASRSDSGRGVTDKLIVVAGNELFAAGESAGLDDNYNGITVGASAWNGYANYANYNRTNTTEDPSPYQNGRVGRYKTDIVAPGGGPFPPPAPGAPGQLLAAPVQWGDARDTFGNTPADGLNSNPNLSGTSFAAPHVSGAAALLQDFATNQGHNSDHRVLKALLLNGASKSISTWDNRAWGAAGPIGVSKNNLQGGGAVQVQIGWDAMMGTGQLDVATSLLNYNAGQHAPGNVAHLNGFDINTVTGVGNTNVYTLGTNVQSITATLCWDRFVTLDDANGDTLWNQGEVFGLSNLNDLDLEVWRTPLGGGAAVMMFVSNSDMDSIEHLAVAVPQAFALDTISIRVRFYNNYTTDYNWEQYGLAWRGTSWVPAPGAVALAAIAGLFGLRRRRPAA